MTDQEMREALRQAMAAWDAATDDQRARALARSADLAERATRNQEATR